MRLWSFFLVFHALCGSQEALTNAQELRLYPAGRRSMKGPPRAFDDDTRAAALANTVRVITKANAEHEAGRKSYFLGYNDLSELTDEQYRAFLGSRPDKGFTRREMQQKKVDEKLSRKMRDKRGRTRDKRVEGDFAEHPVSDGRSDDGNDRDAAADDADDRIDVPMAVDWTTQAGGKYMTPIKNQGTCGSCWAFAGVSVVESRFAIEHDVQASILSVEQVLSCSAPLDHVRSNFQDNMTSSSEGCVGGMPFLTYSYLDLAVPHGISCESTYPYVMATNETETECRSLTAAEVAVGWEKDVSKYKVVAANEQALLRAVTRGPVTANIDATGNGFRHYAGGIYDAQDCRSDGDEVNHAVVVVGFGQTAAGEQFWKLRNTWGTMWGTDGYMRITRGRNVSEYGPCNLYLYADYPVNLTTGSNATTGEAVCAVPSPRFKPLSLLQRIGLSSNQIVLLVLSTVLCVLAGVALYHGTEFVQNRKQAAGNVSYKDSCARWVVPSRDQLAAALARHKKRRQVPMARQ
uniref:Peptidase C1A papain C-terminal domain-containing protein n=1 Tax=Peronospora matthiolae TaxID=2874970 RepID=A0AAV1UTG6_9STRA